MNVLTIKIKIYAPWVRSLKEKRMIVKSILGKVRNKFNVSASEVDAQDIHQTIVIGIAAIVAYQAQADSVEDTVLFIAYFAPSKLTFFDLLLSVCSEIQKRLDDERVSKKNDLQGEE